MPYRKEEFVKLTIRQARSGQAIWLKCLRYTADFYGWAAVFPEWRPEHGLGGQSNVMVGGAYAAAPPHRGGRPHLICRSPSRRGHPAGLTNQFRLSRDSGVADIARLAYVTSTEWCWLDDLRGNRVLREDWLAIAAGMAAREGALSGRLQQTFGVGSRVVTSPRPAGSPRSIRPVFSPSTGAPAALPPVGLLQPF